MLSSKKAKAREIFFQGVIPGQQLFKKCWGKSIVGLPNLLGIYMSPFITNHIIPHCFVSAGCSILVVFYAANLCAQLWSNLFPAQCRHDLDRPTVPWRRPPRNLPRIVEFPTVPRKKPHHQIYGKTANSVFFISVTVFPLPRRTEKKIPKPRNKAGETVAIETVAPGVQNQAM